MHHAIISRHHVVSHPVIGPQSQSSYSYTLIVLASCGPVRDEARRGTTIGQYLRATMARQCLEHAFQASIHGTPGYSITSICFCRSPTSFVLFFYPRCLVAYPSLREVPRQML